MRTLTDIRLSLVPQTTVHAAQMYPLLIHPKLYLHLDDGPPESLNALESRFKRLETRQSPEGGEQWLNWVIRLRDGQLAGYVQASIEDIDCAEIGYVIGTKYWGQGIGTLSTKLMIDELRDNYSVRRFLATVEAENSASIAILKRLEFMQEDNPGETELLFERRV